jgi:ABC-type polar amino acid transport system ATPase subunit
LPTSALDPELVVDDVLRVMRRLAGYGLTMIVVTDEIGFTRDVADRVVFMDRGTIIEEGRPVEILSNPRELRTQRFLRLVERKGGAPCGTAHRLRENLEKPTRVLWVR